MTMGVPSHTTHTPAYKHSRQDRLKSLNGTFQTKIRFIYTKACPSSKSQDVDFNPFAANLFFSNATKFPEN